MTFPQFAKVIVDAPLPELDYTVGDEVQLMVGDRVLVPLGARKVVGIVTGLSDSTEIAAGKLKSVLRVFHEVEPLRKEWLKTMAFAADYYLRPRGEAALSALPPFFDCPLRQPMKGVCRSFANSRRRRSLMNLRQFSTTSRRRQPMRCRQVSATRRLCFSE